MNKVISFSLWGDNPKYTIGAIKNAELALNIYPDWKCYFFIGSSVQQTIIEKLQSFQHIKLIFKNNCNDWRGMFWRFETSFDHDVDISIFRDTDSRLNMREKYAVDEWLNSDKTFHIMRDHPFHNFPILGGMWGMKKNHSYDMESLLKNFDQQNKYGTDYDFFIQVLYPIIGNDKITHDPFFDKINFPKPRIGNEFVGDVFDEKDIRHQEYQKYI